MKVVIDNNVVVDALKPRPPFDAEAKAVFRLFGEEKFEPYVTANSLTDIFYVLQKAGNASKAKAVVANLVSVVNVIPLTERDCTDALDLPMNDFEDAVVAVCAKKAGADCIVSRDEKFIKANTGVKVIKPVDLIAKFKAEVVPIVMSPPSTK
ncbi:MAG: PIN domain-containing protein [Clostridiales Family XIII bacterium]|jgi:predicted nucleic acid-binding protein|nr:PIN domain-containing protein [Clostridiales Family XIII bacterium]